ncbi:MAG: PadR family transcriptional regulator [Polyangiaceae bacterium]|nr:PadR family transcriptional regulator [Polyangiaceae bacterium]
MQEPTYLVLVALGEKPLHGYGIMKAVETLSDGRVKIGAGTLYAALDRLAELDQVELDREETEGGRVRRYYRLTRTGRQVLAEETAVRSRYVARALAILEGKG